MPEFSVRPVLGIGEVVEGTDLTQLALAADPVDGDIVLITSKIVSKAEGMARQMGRAEAVQHDAVRVVAYRGSTRITENHLGLTMAASGVDSSNVAVDSVLLLPRDPDRTARSIRAQIYDASGRNVAVVITDTAGRPWRNGQTDIAIGAAGIEPLQSFAGQCDQHGNPLVVTAPAVVDELAGAGELATGKLGQAPIAVVSGLASSVLAVGLHGPGAAAIVRKRHADMFALGTREAVLAALRGEQLDCFGAAASPQELAQALRSFAISAEHEGDVLHCTVDSKSDVQLVITLARAHAWEPAEVISTSQPGTITLRQRTTPVGP